MSAATATLNQSQFSISLDWDYRDTVTYLSPNINSGSRLLTNAFDNGNSPSQASRVYVIRGQINASSSTTIDLTSLSDFFQGTFSFARIRALCIELVADTAAASILVGAAAATQFTAPFGASTTAIVRVYNGGAIAFFSPSDPNGYVVDGSHKSLKIANEDTLYVATYVLSILGSDS